MKGPLRWALVVPASIFLLAGCSVHHIREVTPPGTPPSRFAESPKGTAGKILQGKWWELFEDRKLNDLMDEAFARNLDLRIAYARLEQARASAQKEGAGKFPSIDLSGQVGRQSTPGFTQSSTGDTYGLSGAARYEIDLWKKIASKKNAALLEVGASREDLKSLYLTLSARVADLYYLAVTQRAQIALTDRTIASFDDTLTRVTRRYHEGLVTALDVYQARQNLFAAKARRPLFVETLAETEHELSILLGHYPGKNVGGDVASLPSIPETFPSGIPSEVLEERPDVKAALLRVKATDERVAAAIADRFPSFNLTGNYGYSSTSTVVGAISGTLWSFLLNLAQPVIDGGRRKAEVKRSDAQFRETLSSYHKAVLTALKEVEDALSKNKTTEERIDHLKRQVDASGGSLRLSKERYLQGLSDYLPVLTAQGSDFTARSNLIDARRQLISDRITLARSLGGIWMEDELKNRVNLSKTEGAKK